MDHQHILTKLSGWQRLWLLAGGLWFVGAAAWTALSFPTEEESRAYWRSNTASWLQSFDDRMKEIRDHCAKVAHTAADDMDIVKYTDCRNANKSSYERAESQKRERMLELFKEAESYIADELPKQQALAVMKGIGIWIFPCLIVYLLGVSVAWVRRGFGGR